MDYKGSSAYEQEDFFNHYMKRRARKDSPNNAIEDPIIYELIGNFRNKSLLDLGCGDAMFGKVLLDQGASSYAGIEGAAQMVASANLNLASSNASIYHEMVILYSVFNIP